VLPELRLIRQKRSGWSLHSPNMIPDVSSAIRRLTINGLWESVGRARRPPRNTCRQKIVIKDRRSGRHRHASLKCLREPSLQELAQLGSGLKLRNWIEFLERRSERVREAPDRPRPEFLVLGLEAKLMHRACQVFRRFQFAFDERLVDDDLGGKVRQFVLLPGFHLPASGQSFAALDPRQRQESRATKTPSSVWPALA